MIKLLLLLTSTLLFTACLNKRGISTKYYKDCHEYYDYQGSYHKICDENEIFETKTITDIPSQIGELFDEDEQTQEENVW